MYVDKHNEKHISEEDNRLSNKSAPTKHHNQLEDKDSKREKSFKFTTISQKAKKFKTSHKIKIQRKRHLSTKTLP